MASVKILPNAVSGQDGQKVALCGSNPYNQYRKTLFPTTRTSAIVEEVVTISAREMFAKLGDTKGYVVIKLDCEGGELAVARG